MERKMTYISLFSSAGVGCYGFKKEGFECIATNELIERRLNVQKFNNKCRYQTGYICGDITKDEVKKQLFDEVSFWRKNENIKKIDLIVATPPCQGMSVANHKKTDNEIIRNSLVIESIKIISELKPNFFIFENVPAFMKTICTDIDKKDKTIAEAIFNNLSSDYSYMDKVINFKNFGACSSRSRTLVIGVLNDFADDISPIELFPNYMKEKTLREVIGHLKPLRNMGEIDDNDFYHNFRVYPNNMRKWIADLKEGESAFDNEDVEKKPHQVINGKIIINKQKNGDKYRRQFWDKVGPCIHTRNDQLASQNTIHPSDDRVFSIRELMLMMTVPNDFKWVDMTLSELNKLPLSKKKELLKKEEVKIRQSLGEAVPTIIFQSIARKIKNFYEKNLLSKSQITKIIIKEKLNQKDNLLKFINENKLNLSNSTLSRIAELSNSKRVETAAYFTNKYLITEIIKKLPEFEKDELNILEPSIGIGNFIPLLLKKYKNKKINLDVIDIDEISLSIFDALMKKYDIDKKVKINCINADFLEYKIKKHYDLIIGNPPFGKTNYTNTKTIENYKLNAKNKNTNNICSFFLDKAIDFCDYLTFVFPKFLLNTPEFAETRNYLSKKSIECIIDFGEKGFSGVLIETIALFINNKAKPTKTRVISIPNKIDLIQNQKYICDDKLPYWILYRNDEFDLLSKKMSFDVFDVFRDRQITNSMLKETGDIRVLKSRNISNDGKEILNLKGYDAYINKDEINSLSVSKYLNADNVFLAPNMTYYSRVMKKPKGIIVNGSVAILIPKNKIEPTKKQIEFLSSDIYRKFYRIARNYQTRSLNIDNCSIYYYGLLKEDKND